MLITKESLRFFKKDVEKALKKLEADYGVKITAGSSTYSDDNFSLTLQVANITSSGMKVTTQKALNDLDWFKNIYGKTFTEGRHTFKVVDYEYGKKYSVICIRDDGEEYSFHPSIADEKEFLDA